MSPFETGRSRVACTSSVQALVALVRVIFRQILPLISLLMVGLVGAMCWWVATGDAQLVIAAGQAWALVVMGLVVPFLLHEWMHAFVALDAAGVRQVWIERNVLRLSVAVDGDMSSRRTAAAAIAGPGACLVAGAFFASMGLTWSAIACAWHVVFLLPIFGDGRALVIASRRGGFRARRVEESQLATGLMEPDRLKN